MKRAVTLSALETALFGADWDGSCAAQALALYRAKRESTHLHRAIAALRDAKASLASAERFAAKLHHGRDACATTHLRQATARQEGGSR